MHYIVHCLDREDGKQLRLEHLKAHKEYLANTKTKVIIGGPLVADDGETGVGSCFVVEVESKEDAVNFSRNDPYTIAGLWKQVSINCFLKRMDNR